MNKFLNTPKAVVQARESQKGLHLVLEILIFIAVFIVCTIAEVIPMMPAQMIMLMRDQNYLDAVATGDVNRIAEASVQATNNDTYSLIALFATAMMILMVMLFCKFIQKRKIETIGFTKKGTGVEYIKGVAVGFVMFSAAVLICVVTGSLKLERMPGTFAVSTFLLFIAGYMVQGMAEEVLCRGYFMVSIGRRYSMTVAVIANSVAFAALHLLNPGISALAIINLTLFGIFASVCFIKTENIWMVGAIHSIWNLVQGNVYGIKVSGMETSCTIFSSTMTEGRSLIHGGDFGLEGGLAVTIVLVIGIVVFCLYKKNDAQGAQYGNNQS